MRKMNQEEFDKMTFDKSPKDCDHPDVVRLYTMGSNTDYGCTSCGLQHTSREAFERHGLEGYR